MIKTIDPDDKNYEPRLVPKYLLGMRIGYELIAVKKGS